MFGVITDHANGNGNGNVLGKEADVLKRVRDMLPTDPDERIRLLHQLLGEPACRSVGIYPIPRGFKLSVVIPVYNEERWIREVVRRVQAVDIPKEIVIVEDCSRDNTRDILRDIAAANGVEDPLAIRPGALLGIPRIER